VELPTALTKFNGRAATGGQSYSSLTFLYILPDDEEVGAPFNSEKRTWRGTGNVSLNIKR
jgi:hypothetical protein